jgi:magnesium chelatase family protein
MGVSKYLAKISGPLLDRLDIHVEVPPVDFNELSGKQKCESSSVIKARVDKTRKLQQLRYAGSGVACNARLTPSLLKKHCILTNEAKTLLKRAFESMGLSARAYDRILKVSRTIADLEQCENIDVSHVAEAVQYRSLDRKYWNK